MPTKGTPKYGECAFSLAPWQKDTLETALRPYLGRKLEETNKGALAIIVKAMLPPEVLPQLKRVLTREIDAPVVIHNLPEIPWDHTFAERARAAKKDALTHSMAFWVTQGLFELSDCESRRSDLLLRQSAEQTTPSFEIHRDRNPVSALSCLHNTIHACTEFINMRNVLAELPDDIKDRLTITPLPTSGVTSSITLTELEDRLGQLRYTDNGIAHGIIINTADANPTDLAAYEKAIENNKITIDIQPGTLVLWDTAYHRARNGKIAAVDPTGYTRAAIYNSAGYNRI